MLVISICAGFICSCRSIRMYQAAWRLALTTDAAPTLRLRTTAGILRWGDSHDGLYVSFLQRPVRWTTDDQTTISGNVWFSMGRCIPG